MGGFLFNGNYVSVVNLLDALNLAERERNLFPSGTLPSRVEKSGMTYFSTVGFLKITMPRM